MRATQSASLSLRGKYLYIVQLFLEGTIMKTFWDYQKDEEDKERLDKEKSPDLSESAKKLRINSERQELLENISSSSVNTLRDKVAWILNHYPDARDSDITLQLKYWETFYPDKYDGQSIKPSDLYNLPHLTSLSRERARIQNQYNLFVAIPEVRKIRGTLSDEEREKSIEDKPTYPLFVVYMDDSGKTGDKRTRWTRKAKPCARSLFSLR